MTILLPNTNLSLSDGLILHIPLGNVGECVDVVSGKRLTATGMTNQSSPLGDGLLFGAGSYLNGPSDLLNIKDTQPISIAWEQLPLSTSSYSTVLGFKCSLMTHGFLIYQAVSDSGYYFSVGPQRAGFGANFSSNVGPATNGKLDKYLLVMTGGVASASYQSYLLYRNGVEVKSHANTDYAFESIDYFRVGSLRTGGDPFEGVIKSIRMWSRVLSKDEAVILNNYSKKLEPIPTAAPTNNKFTSLPPGYTTKPELDTVLNKQTEPYYAFNHDAPLRPAVLPLKVYDPDNSGFEVWKTKIQSFPQPRPFIKTTRPSISSISTQPIAGVKLNSYSRLASKFEAAYLPGVSNQNLAAKPDSGSIVNSDRTTIPLDLNHGLAWHHTTTNSTVTTNEFTNGITGYPFFLVWAGKMYGTGSSEFILRLTGPSHPGGTYAYIAGGSSIFVVFNIRNSYGSPLVVTTNNITGGTFARPVIIVAQSASATSHKIVVSGAPGIASISSDAGSIPMTYNKLVIGNPGGANALSTSFMGAGKTLLSDDEILWMTEDISNLFSLFSVSKQYPSSSATTDSGILVPPYLRDPSISNITSTTGTPIVRVDY
jgi:hypothetical protein